jgi:hypothetical protein
MTTHPVIDGRLPAVVYRTLGGFTYRVLDQHDDERFGDVYPTLEDASRATHRDGFYPVINQR